MTPMTDERWKEILAGVNRQETWMIGELLTEIDRLRLALRTVRTDALKEAELICAQHGDWRWLRETYPDVILGAGCDQAQGADLCESAINALLRKETNEPA